MRTLPDKRVVLTGSSGFIGGYIACELLDQGYGVLGIDNYSKYGPIPRPQDQHRHYQLLQYDLTCDAAILGTIVARFAPQYIIANAAKIGGINYFHKFPYTLLAVNDRIISNTFDIALREFQEGSLKRILVMSSSMVYENATKFPSAEDDARNCPPPSSTYGQSKLHAEYYCQGAFEQYGLPFTIVRPFNCVGVGEDRAVDSDEVFCGNVQLALSHVLVDFCVKALREQCPMRIFGDGSQIRCLTHGSDIARGIRMCLESPLAVGQTFNISTSESISMLELARRVYAVVWPGREFSYVCDPAFRYDVRCRIPDVAKAQEMLDFTATVPLQDSIVEVVRYVRDNLARL